MNTRELKEMQDAELEVVMLGDSSVIATSVNPPSPNICSSNCPCNGEECLAKGTKITMFDGTDKNIEDIIEGDYVLTFDHETGKIVSSKVHFVYRSEDQEFATTLKFSDGNKLSIVGEHDLFEQESLKYVTITKGNAIEFIGKHFYNALNGCYVELVDVIQETEAVDYYDIYTSVNQNCIANGMLNVADDVDYMLNIYDFDENLKANVETLSKDIDKYGLFKHTNMLKYTNEEFIDWNIKYLNIALGKGLVSIEEIVEKSNEYFDLLSNRKKAQCA